MNVICLIILLLKVKAVKGVLLDGFRFSIPLYACKRKKMHFVAIRLLILISFTCGVSRTENTPRIAKPESFTDKDNFVSKREDIVEETDLRKEFKVNDNSHETNSLRLQILANPLRSGNHVIKRNTPVDPPCTHPHYHRAC